VLVVVGVMSIAWMSVITIVLVVQKLLPARTALDLPIALAILALGLVIVISPSSVPGLMPPM
jgi:predicted metal-binding membrane protein